jgi:hypothetical protein
MGGPSRSLCFTNIALWVIGARKPSLHDKAGVLEEASENYQLEMQRLLDSKCGYKERSTIDLQKTHSFS